jgi:hypothetical protein
VIGQSCQADFVGGSQVLIKDQSGNLLSVGNINPSGEFTDSPYDGKMSSQVHFTVEGVGTASIYQVIAAGSEPLYFTAAQMAANDWTVNLTLQASGANPAEHGVRMRGELN